MPMTVSKVGGITPLLTDREAEASCGALTCLGLRGWLGAGVQAVPILCMLLLGWPVWPH